MSRLLWIVGAVVRLARLPHVWERISDRILSERLETILHLNHIITFVWFAIGSAESSNTGLHWLEQTIWLGDHTLPDEADAPLYLYLTAFNFRTTQMIPGSMDVQPRNAVERTIMACWYVLLLLAYRCNLNVYDAVLQEQERSNKQDRGAPAFLASEGYQQ